MTLYQKSRKRGLRCQPSFSGQNLFIFLYLCTSKGEICPISNLFPIFKAILLWYMNGRQSKHAVFSKLEKQAKFLPLSRQTLGDWYFSRRGMDLTPFRTMAYYFLKIYFFGYLHLSCFQVLVFQAVDYFRNNGRCFLHPKRRF